MGLNFLPDFSPLILNRPYEEPLELPVWIVTHPTLQETIWAPQLYRARLCFTEHNVIPTFKAHCPLISYRTYQGLSEVTVLLKDFTCLIKELISSQDFTYGGLLEPLVWIEFHILTIVCVICSCTWHIQCIKSYSYLKIITLNCLVFSVFRLRQIWL